MTCLDSISGSTASHDIASEDALAQVREGYTDNDEAVTEIMWKDAKALQAVVTEIVPVKNARNTSYAHRLPNYVKCCTGDADANDVVRNGSDKGTCTDRGEGVSSIDVAGYRGADLDVGSEGHANCDSDRNLHDDGESDGNGDSDDNSVNEVDIAAVGHDVDVVLHGSGDHDDVLDNDNVTTLFRQALPNISKFADAPDFCFYEEEDLSVSDLFHPYTCC